MTLNILTVTPRNSKPDCISTSRTSFLWQRKKGALSNQRPMSLHALWGSFLLTILGTNLIYFFCSILNDYFHSISQLWEKWYPKTLPGPKIPLVTSCVSAHLIWPSQFLLQSSLSVLSLLDKTCCWFFPDIFEHFFKDLFLFFMFPPSKRVFPVQHAFLITRL